MIILGIYLCYTCIFQELASHYEACVSEENTICPWCGKEFRGTASGTFDQHRKRKHFWGFFR